MLRLLIFGPQLSGKGTQAAIIAKEYGLAHITTGGILREMYAKGDEATRADLQPSMEGGVLYPDDKMNELVVKYLDRVATGFILDGYPRTLPQAQFFDAYLQRKGIKLDAALLIELAREEIAKRLDFRIKTEGRKDDQGEGAVEKRLAAYEHKTLPVVAHYKRLGILFEIDGAQTREEVFRDVKKALAPIVKKQR